MEELDRFKGRPILQHELSDEVFQMLPETVADPGFETCSPFGLLSNN